jgi:hypothetical protein
MSGSKRLSTLYRARHPEQKQAAAQAVVGTLPAEVKQDMAATVVQGLDTPVQKQAAAQTVLGTLPADIQQQVASTVLGSASQHTRDNLWYLVVWTLTVAVFVFGSMTFVRIYQKSLRQSVRRRPPTSAAA